MNKILHIKDLEDNLSVRMLTIHIVLFYSFGFTLLYFEQIHLFGIKISIMWKSLLIGFFLVMSFLKVGKNKSINYFILFYILFSFKIFFSVSSLDNMSITFELFIKSLFFIGLYLYFSYYLNIKTLILFGKHFSILIILSFLPFILGFLQPLSEGYGLYRFGAVDQFGLIGIFQRPHAASISIAFSMIIIYFYSIYEKNIKIKYFYYLLLLLGLYEMIFTYVRTGILIFLIGFLYLYLTQKDKLKYLKIFILIFIFALLFIYLYNTNEIFQMRMSDQTIYNDAGNIGSGRFVYAYYAIQNWYSEGYESIVIGLGLDYARELMYQDVGMRIFAHNGYIQILQAEGLIGVFLYLSFLYFLIKFILTKKQNMFYTINIAMLLAYLTMMFLQGGVYFYMMVYISTYLALMNKTKNIVRSNTCR